MRVNRIGDQFFAPSPILARDLNRRPARCDLRDKIEDLHHPLALADDVRRSHTAASAPLLSSVSSRAPDGASRSSARSRSAAFRCPTAWRNNRSPRASSASRRPQSTRTCRDIGNSVSCDLGSRISSIPACRSCPASGSTSTKSWWWMMSRAFSALRSH